MTYTPSFISPLLHLFFHFHFISWLTFTRSLVSPLLHLVLSLYSLSCITSLFLPTSPILGFQPPWPSCICLSTSRSRSQRTLSPTLNWDATAVGWDSIHSPGESQIGTIKILLKIKSHKRCDKKPDINHQFTFTPSTNSGSGFCDITI